MSSNLQARLSVVVPCYNEEATIATLLDRVLQQAEVAEVIVVDDGSTDGSVSVVSAIEDPRIRLIQMPRNGGKGSAVSAGFKAVTAPYVVIQDADLEYDPSEYGRLIAPLDANLADVVFGSRFLVAGSRRALYFWHRVGNQFLTLLSNVFTNIDLTDMETCFKMMRTEIAQALDIQEPRFGIEPEITAKVAAMRLRIYEVPSSYYGRTYEEGKKITWRDGFSALRCIVKYNLQARRSHRRWK